MDREQFLKERLTGLGGSDIHHLFNAEPYGCARKLWYEKTEQTPDYPVVASNVMKRGNKLEQLIRDEYVEVSGRKIRRVNRMITNTKIPWAMCHLDAEIVAVDDRGTGILECKSVGRPMYYKVRDEGITDSWIFQMQHYLLTTGRKWGSYAILWADNWEFIHFDIELDKELEHSILEAGESFWRMVQNGPAPERLDAKDKRCTNCEFRNTCKGEKFMELDEVQSEDVPLDESLDSLMSQYLTLKELQQEATALFNGKKKEVQDALGAGVFVDCTGFRLFYKPIESTRLKSSALKEDNPELYEKYSYKSVSRPFRIKPI